MADGGGWRSSWTPVTFPIISPSATRASVTPSSRPTARRAASSGSAPDPGLPRGSGPSVSASRRAQYRPDVGRRRRQMAAGVAELVVRDAVVAGGGTDVVAETGEPTVEVAGRVPGARLACPGRPVPR